MALDGVDPGMWSLDPAIAFCNHGSYGVCPAPVLRAQHELRAEMERGPVEFLLRQLPQRLDAVRERSASFLGCDPADLVFVRNASAGIAAALASLDLRPGDEIVITDHAYPAVRNAVARTCERAGARARIVPIPLPLPSDAEIVDAVAGALGPRSRLVIADAVTSPTAIVMPVEAIVRACRNAGVMVMVDGAHAPGMLPVDLSALDADLFTGNLHKWVCTPKGAAVLHVARTHHERIRPTVTSHGAGKGLQAEFDWVGTDDPTAVLSIPAALDLFDAIGWERVRAHNNALALRGRDIVAAALGAGKPVPDDRAGSMAIVPLPPGVAADKPAAEALRHRLFDEHAVEVAISTLNGSGFVRLSAQIYNEPSDYERVGAALSAVL